MTFFWPPYGVSVKDEAEEYEHVALKDVVFTKYLTTFFNSTSLQGIPQLVRERGFLKKLLWLFAIIACALGLYWQMSSFVGNLVQWNANVAVNVETARTLYFPAITICNNNPTWLTDNDQLSMTSARRKKRGLLDSLLSQTTSGNLLSGVVDSLLDSTGVTNLTQILTPIDNVTSSLVDDILTSVGDSLGSVQDTLNQLQNESLSLISSLVNQTASNLADVVNNVVSSLSNQTSSLNRSSQTSTQLFSAIKQTASATLMEEQVTQTYHLQETISQYSYENRKDLGHQLCDMIVGCRYNGDTCDNTKDFSVWHWNPLYGNCYTFNGGYKVVDKKSTSNQLWDIKLGSDGSGIKMSYRQGDNYGLYLLMNADTERYSSETLGVGWRIVIHNQTQMPFPEDGGIFVAPGTSTRIALSLTSTTRLGVVSNPLYTAKYSDCLQPSAYQSDDPRNAFTQMMEVDYSTSACFKTCYQRAVMTKCGCYDTNYPHTGKAFDSVKGASSLTGCVYSDETKWGCKDNVFIDYSQQNIECDCPDSCNEISFNYAVSHLKWPSYKRVEKLCADLKSVFDSRVSGTDTTCQSTSYIASDANNHAGHGIPDSQLLLNELGKCGNSTLDEASFRGQMSLEEFSQFFVGSRFGEVYIYYRDFNYQTIEESENISLQDLLGWVGGILGLFFGFSMMTLFEYFQLIIDVICIAFAKMSGQSYSNAKLAPISASFDQAGSHLPQQTYRPSAAPPPPLLPSANNNNCFSANGSVKSTLPSARSPPSVCPYLGPYGTDSTLYFNNGIEKAVFPVTPTSQ